MGCISAKVERITESPKVAVTKEGACEVEITGIVSAIKAFVTYLHSLIVSITCNRTPLNVEVSHTNNMNVSVSLVCSVSISDDVEMWWCDGWKALWNNNLKILWRKEEQ